MVQVSTNTEWLLQGFRYELESTVRPQTVEYYCGEVSRFLRWAKTAIVPADIRLITKHDIQAFLHHLALTRGGNSSKSDPGQIERVRWPYYRALCRFFAWAVREGYLEQSPMDGIKLKAPKDLPVEPYCPEHIDRMLKVLDHDWQVARTPRQKMLAARDRAILLLFLESGLRQIQRHHDERLKAVLDAVVSGAKTAYEITAQVPWDIGAWQDMSMWDRYLALGEALAHLEFLLQEGRIRKAAEGTILLFQPA